MPGTAIILQGDARNLVLPDACVDLIVTSPPYFGLRSYEEEDGVPLEGQIGAERTPAEYIDSLIDCTAEWTRVLKPGGSIWVNLGDKYSQYEGTRKGHGRSLAGDDRSMTGQPLDMPTSAPTQWGVPNKSLMLLPQRYAIACADKLGLIVRAEVIWDKTNGLPESVKDRTRRSHETWLHFTKRPRYYCDIDAVRQPYDPTSIAAKAGNSHGQSQAMMPGHNGRVNGNAVWEPSPLGGLPPSVWRYPTQPLRLPAHLNVKHYATFPPRIVHRIVSGWCPIEICTACGQGRRSVTEQAYREPNDAASIRTRSRLASLSSQNHHGSTLGYRAHTAERRIVGQTCGCSDTDASATPGVVLDPMGGVGTAALVAKALDRIGISVDLSSAYCRAARWRCDDPKSLERAARP